MARGPMPEAQGRGPRPEAQGSSIKIQSRGPDPSPSQTNPCISICVNMMISVLSYVVFGLGSVRESSSTRMSILRLMAPSEKNAKVGTDLLGPLDVALSPILNSQQLLHFSSATPLTTATTLLFRYSTHTNDHYG